MNNIKELKVSGIQEAIYFSYLKSNVKIDYNIHKKYNIKSFFNFESFKTSIQEVFKRRDILRTKFVFKNVDNQPQLFSVVDDECSVPFEYFINEDFQETEKNFLKPYNLGEAPLFRIGFINNEEMMIDMHQIITDKISPDSLMKEITMEYKKQNNISTQDQDKELEYIEKIFNCNFNKLLLPLKESYKKNAISGLHKLNKISITVEGEDYKNIKNYISSKNLQEKIFISCVYSFILSKYSNQDVIYTSFIDNEKIDLDEKFFSNMNYIFPILIKYNIKDSSMIDVYNETIDVVNIMNKINHQEFLDSLNLFATNNGILFDIEKDETDHYDDKKYDNFFDENYYFDFGFKVSIYNQKYHFSFYYNEFKFETFLVNNMLDGFKKVISNISNFEKNLKDIDYISDQEIDKLLHSFNSNKCDIGKNKVYHYEFTNIAKELGNKTAIIFENKEYSYKTVDEMSNSIGNFLKSIGVKRGDVVSIICDRTLNLVVASIGVLKAGAAFSLIDPELPKDRIQFMIREADANVILKSVENKEFPNPLFDESDNIFEYVLDSHDFTKNTEEIPNENSYNDPCCIYFTSGTTGRPKGISISHRNVVNLCYHALTCSADGSKQYFDYDILLSFTKVTYIISLAELFLPLLRRKTILLCNNSEYSNPQILGDIMNQYPIGVIVIPPTRILFYLRNENFRKGLKKIKNIIFGGELATLELLKNVTQFTDANLYICYGLTELTCIVTVNDISKREIIYDELVTIGKPSCNNEVYILDENHQLVPIGVEGEIYIGGNGVSMGYINQEKLTNAVFLDCPFVKGTKMFKAGDLGRWTSDGRIVNLGRADLQIKIRGQRVELSEIENTIREINGIDYAVVVDKINKESKEKYLVGYYITRQNITDSNIRDYLKRKLPEFMIPNYFIKIDKIPLNAHGKLDRKVLPDPDIDKILAHNYVAPETEIEKKLCKICSTVFKMDENKIGKNSSFFDLGGNSLNALTISGLIEKELKIKLNIKDILSHPSIFSLAQFMDDILKSNNSIYKVNIIEKTSNNEFQVTSHQLGMYIESVKNPKSIAYNIPITLELKPNIDIEKIKKAFLMLFEKQKILKSRYYTKNNDKTKGEVYGTIDENCKLEFEEYTEENASGFVRPFDLSKAPLIRVGFIKNKILLIDLHHIISDGTSMSIIINEINNYYYNNTMNELEVQYSDYAINMYQRMNDEKIYSKQVNYYKQMFDCDYDVLNFPRLNTSINKTFAKENERNYIKYIAKNIDKSLGQNINNYIKVNRLSKTSFFLTVYGFVLSKFSNQEVIYSTLIGNNRNDRLVNNMIGMFVSTQPILLKFNEGISFKKIIKENMNMLLDLYSNQNLSYSQLTNLLKLKKVNNSFTYQPEYSFGTSFDNTVFSDYKHKDFVYGLSNKMGTFDNIATFDIAFNLYEKKDEYSISIEYNSNIYSSKMIERFIDCFFEVLKNIESFENTIENIDYINEEELKMVVLDFNNDKYKRDTNKFYYDAFIKVANENPEKCAIIFNDTKITYGELNEMSNSLAHYLRSKGVERNDIVPIISDRSPYFIISTLAISKAGGAFLPVDKKLPIQRIQYILEDVNANIILYSNTEDIINEIKKLDKNYEVYNLREHNYEINKSPINSINEPDDTCYVLFTSGTTGKPKGTLLSHFNIYNYVREFKNDKNFSLYNLLLKNNNIKNILALTNFSFDISHDELTFSLVHGLTITLVDDIKFNDISLLGKYISKNNVDLINTTPSRFRLCLDNDDFKKGIKDVKALIFIGEILPKELCKDIHCYSKCKIYNGYGPTECTVVCSYTDEVNENDEEPITIGKQITNYKLYILDKHLKPVPIGVEGEIIIGGYGVGKGYLNRDELTKEKFINNPFNIGNDPHNRIMYRTGDLGKWKENGEIDYIGRIDFQVKIHGQRIELGEIENTIKEMKGIDFTVVFDKMKDNGEKYLICYYMTNNDEIQGKMIRKYLKTKLPLYMIPNYFIRINDIPLSSSGKLDRKGLPEPTTDDLIKETYVAPESHIEKVICEIYSEIFNINLEEIGVLSDFYDLGGDSLNAIKVVSRVEKEFNIKLNIKDILLNPLIKDLAKRIEEISNNKNSLTGIKKIERQHKLEFPVTPQQLGIYIDSSKNPNTVMYNLPLIFKLNENINIEKLKESIQKLFETQEILRSRYENKEIDGQIEVYGFIDNDCKLEFEQYTFENSNQFVRPFDLSKAPLIRVGFIDNKVLLIDMHHIMSDGATSLIMMNELNKYYKKNYMEDIPVQFSDYALYMNELKTSGYLNKQIEFYKNIFNCEYETLQLSNKETINNSNSDNISNVGNYTQIINNELSETINEFVKNNGISKTAFFITIYGYVLSKYSGQDVIYSAFISANRNNEYMENMIGMFVSTLPILLKFENENESLLDTIKKNMNLLINMYANQDISFSELTKVLKLKNINNSFIYQPVEEFSKNIENELFDDKENQFSIDREEIINKNSNNVKFDISVNIVENKSDYSIVVEYNKNVFNEVAIDRIINSYIEIIKNISKSNESIKDIEYIPSKEKNRIINDFNSNIYKNYDNLYHKEFEKVVKTNMNKCAIINNDVEITYKKLDEMSNSLANYLRKQNIGRGDIVPIISERSYYFVVAFIAVLKAGAAYLPVDPDFPVDRIEYMINEVNAKLILEYISTNSDNSNKLKFENKNIIKYSLQNHEYKENINEIDNVNEGNDLSYVLFTSGTTGKPKGTLLTHESLVNYCIYSHTNNGIDNIFDNLVYTVLASAKFTFDLSICEIHSSLLKGNKIILCNDEEYNNPELISKLIIKHKIDYLLSVPSRIENYISNDEFSEAIKNIKLVFLGGEKLNEKLVRLFTNNNSQVLNCYGPTETTVGCTAIKYTKENVDSGNISFNSIGKPLCNYKLYILDKYLKPVPVGVEGEIFIGGLGVGKGYLNRDELTKEKFIENPFNTNNDNSNRIIYRTGDLGRWRENGEIEYMGRIDFQVKIHGQRIELGEIENTIQEKKEINQCIVVDKMNKNHEKYLICYYIPNESIKTTSIRNYLKKRLPRYMIPSYFKKIDSVPLSSSGKLDRKKLPEPTREDIVKEKYVAPKTKVEKVVCKIFSEIFNVDINEIGIRNDFYELGGDSLNVIKVIAKIEKELHIKLNIKDVFYNSIIYSLSQHIEKRLTNEKYTNDEIKRLNKSEFPITSQQLGIYIESDKNPGTIIYNLPLMFTLKENVNIDKIKKGFIELFNSQEILRSKYGKKEVNGKVKVYGFIDNNCKLEFEHYTFKDKSKFIRPFDMSKAPLIRVGFVDDKILLIDMHHIISDGTTSMIIMKELNKYYVHNKISNIPVQFSDYALYINKMKNKEIFNKQVQFYQKMFNCNYEVLNIQLKNDDRDIQNDSNVGTYTKLIDSELSKDINEFVKNYSISKTAFFITIYGYVLSKYSGQNIIYSSVISANRNNSKVGNMIGMFVSTLPILLKYENEDESFIDVMKKNMKLLVDIYDNQNISFVELSKLLKLKNVNNSFVYQPKNESYGDFEDVIFENSSDISINKNEFANEIADQSKFDITFNIVDNEKDYSFIIEYNNNIYSESTIDRILNSYIEVIKNISNFNKSINEIEYITEEEKLLITKTFNNNIFKFKNDKVYHEEFKKVANQYPNKCAIIFEGKEITYKDLDEMSNSLAHYLRKQNIGRGDIVPIISERSYYFIVAFIAVLKAGAAYLPVDPDFPKERIEYMINEVKAKLILKYLPHYEIDFGIIQTYPLENHCFTENIENIENINKGDDICYVLFTSGTTGKPKGAMLSHLNIVNYTRYGHTFNGEGDYFVDKFENALAICKFTHDISVGEIHYPLMRGNKIILSNDEEFNNPELLSNLIIKYNVDYIFSVPSRLDSYMKNEVFANSIKNIKYILIGGEKVEINVVKILQKYANNCNVCSIYGPTETTVLSNIKKLDKITDSNFKTFKMSTGKPMCNYFIYILDKYLKPVPVGIKGEIFLGGYCVCKGYLNQDKLTKESFVHNPFNYDNDENNRIMYKSGDLGKWNENGEVVCLGREDFQVKIHGQRIELGEIESTIQKMKEINQCIVIDKINKNQQNYLICYYISNESIQNTDIRNYLKERLPRYMIPSYFKKIDSFPLTFNGKLDRKRLPDPTNDDIGKEKSLPPETLTEIELCKIYSEIFKVNINEIGRTTDFYEIGGDSLNAIKLASKIRRRLNINISIKDIMKNSKISELAKICETLKVNNNIKDLIVKIKDNHEFPASSIISSLPFNASKMSLDSINQFSNNMWKCYKINDDIDINKLIFAFNEIINRHDILRAYFIEKKVNGKTKIFVKIRDKMNIKIEQLTIENFTDFIRPFDITKDVLIRVGMIDKKVLIIDMDHKIADGYSFGILLKELNQLYNNKKLKNLPFNYSDYAVYYDKSLKDKELIKKHINYYKQVFDCSIERPINLNSRNAEYKYNNDKLYKRFLFKTNKEFQKIVNNLSVKYNLSKTAFFVTIYSLILSVYSNEKNIFIAVVNSNRTYLSTDNLIGLFVQYIPTFIKFGNGSDNFVEKIKEIMYTILTSNDIDIPLSLISEQLNLPQCNTWFKFDPYDLMNNKSIFFGEEIDFKGIYELYNRKEIMKTEDDVLSKFKNTKNLLTLENQPDLIFILSELSDNYVINFNYDENLYNESLISEISSNFVKTIEYCNNSVKDISINDIINQIKSNMKI